MSRLEQWLEKRSGLASGEIGLTPTARERVFRRPQGVVPVPTEIVGFVGESRPASGPPEYQIVDPVTEIHELEGRVTDLKPMRRVAEDKITAGIAVADKSLLGEDRKYDETFLFLQSEPAKKRVERIRKKARKVRAVTALAGVAALAAATGTLNGPVPELVKADSCERGLRGPDNDERLIVKAGSDISHENSCTVNGEEYYIVPKSEE